jgi:hypothetical protein
VGIGVETEPGELPHHRKQTPILQRMLKALVGLLCIAMGIWMFLHPDSGRTIEDPTPAEQPRPISDGESHQIAVYYANAKTAIRTGQLKDAEYQLQACLDIDPDDVPSLQLKEKLDARMRDMATKDAVARALRGAEVEEPAVQRTEDEQERNDAAYQSWADSQADYWNRVGSGEVLSAEFVGIPPTSFHMQVAGYNRDQAKCMAEGACANYTVRFPNGKPMVCRVYEDGGEVAMYTSAYIGE